MCKGENLRAYHREINKGGGEKKENNIWGRAYSRDWGEKIEIEFGS